MLKFVSILVMMVSMGFGSPVSDNSQIEEVMVEFSEKALGIESGQPIFSKETKITVSNTTETEIKLYINDDEKEMMEKKVEISGLESGTYTLMIVDAKKTEEKRTVGFTIQ